MKAGVKFPPINIGTIKTAEDPEALYLIDGLHRLKAYKMLDVKEVEVEIKHYESFNEAFHDSVRRNITHGQPFTAYEVAGVIKRLLEEGRDLVYMATLLQMTLDDVKKFIDERLVEVEENVYEVVKEPVRSVKHRITSSKIAEEQRGLTGISQIKLVGDIVKIIEIGLLDVDNKKLMNRLENLYDLLKTLFSKT
uniref:Uncharacterized protein n=1 Tax=viral metagenome TaxID=1070528 RepID=A0A6M3LWI5_9ZZZZ